ncbi:permease [Microbulbifer sp. EKSA005]|uniref:permease n=1 Tax=Microbulbifer sp. EKSA005 TaxID=3243364 RepID=UPI004041782A
MPPEFVSMLEEALSMFAFLAVELTVLFLAISYLVGVLQQYITPEKIQATLSSRNGRGYVIAALLGSITPFCSCSTIPFLKGLLRARAGFGPMMVFLFSSPLLNPIVIGLLIFTFGLNVAIFYFTLAMTVSISAGFALEKFGFERFVRDGVYRDTNSKNPPSPSENKGIANNLAFNNGVLATTGATNIATISSLSSAAKTGETTSCCINTPANSCDSEGGVETQKLNRWVIIWNSTWIDFKKTLPYLLLGISLGSFIYGFVPTDLIVTYAGENKWYAIPIAAVIGIPLYIRASAVIPLSAGLVQKGMALGSVMALIIGSAGASLTEVILLRSIFKTQVITAFLVVVLGMAVTAGYLYPLLF